MKGSLGRANREARLLGFTAWQRDFAADPDILTRTLMLDGRRYSVAGAAALTRSLRTLLFGVTPFDPATFVGVSVLLAAVALAACYVPARRATRVNPIVARRAE